MWTHVMASLQDLGVGLRDHVERKHLLEVLLVLLDKRLELTWEVRMAVLAVLMVLLEVQRVGLEVRKVLWAARMVWLEVRKVLLRAVDLLAQEAYSDQVVVL